MQITRTITDLKLTGEDWELYTFDDASEATANECAVRLNRKFEELVNAGRTRGEVEQGMMEFMAQPENSEAGAYDSEPRYQLERLLKKVFAS